MSNDIKITGLKMIVELNDSDEWQDLSELMPDELVEEIELVLDNIEKALNENFKVQKYGGLH